jgi:RimJ/RimL family protein N-acetyltransferase
VGPLARWLRPRTAGRALPVPPVGFTDGTVALRPWRPSDGLALAELCDDDEIRRRTGVPEVYPAQEAAGRAAFGEAERLAGRGVYLAVVDARDAVLHGAIDLRTVDAEARTAELGYLLGAAHRGRGTMTRAVELLAGWAFGPVGVERLEVRIDADNAASLAVAERAGFVRADGPAGTDRDGERVVLHRWRDAARTGR